MIIVIKKEIFLLKNENDNIMKGSKISRIVFLHPVWWKFDMAAPWNSPKYQTLDGFPSTLLMEIQDGCTLKLLKWSVRWSLILYTIFIRQKRSSLDKYSLLLVSVNNRGSWSMSVRFFLHVQVRKRKKIELFSIHWFYIKRIND